MTSGPLQVDVSPLLQMPLSLPLVSLKKCNLPIQTNTAVPFAVPFCVCTRCDNGNKHYLGLEKSIAINLVYCAIYSA